MCIDAARDAWNTENYIYFDTALYRFQFHRKKYVSLMSLKNEDYKERLVEGILSGDFYLDNFSRKTKYYSMFLWFRRQKSPV